MLSLNIKYICSFLILILGISSLFLILKLRKMQEETAIWSYFQVIVSSLFILLFIYSSNQIIKTTSPIVDNIKLNIWISLFISTLYIFFLIFISILVPLYKKIRLIYPIMELERIKSDFVAKVSHELVTPLTSIKGAVRLIAVKQDNLDKQQIELMEIIKHNTERLIRLVNDLLDLSKIESGKIELILEPVNLLEVTKKSIQNLTPLMEKKYITLSLDSFKKIPDIFLDRVRIEQVLDNLIENAIKFTPEGGCININIRDREEDIFFSISNTGAGIHSQGIEKIFTKSYWPSKALLYKGASGAGLGLPLAKGIIKAHKGTIWAESTTGKGSKFFFSLPKEKRQRKRSLNFDFIH